MLDYGIDLDYYTKEIDAAQGARERGASLSESSESSESSKSSESSDSDETIEFSEPIDIQQGVVREPIDESKNDDDLFGDDIVFMPPGTLIDYEEEHSDNEEDEYPFVTVWSDSEDWNGSNRAYSR